MGPTRSTIWTFPPCDDAAADLLARELKIQPLTARLLVNRGFCDPDVAARFLHPDLSHLHDPFLLPDMDKASRRIADAITAGETILVHGDYDVDGVTSTALYVRALQALGANILYRVPHRKRDGYDLKIHAIDWGHGQGASLVITSDCGIQAHEAVTHANGLGMTVIVTDHHEPGATLPPAYAVVNPHRHDSTYPFASLAGVGVAFKTMQAVVRLLKPEHEASFLKRFLDLTACGTVADVMPLVDENRVFASHGLAALSQTKKVGLRALLEGARIDLTKRLTAEAVGFGIGPRINAAGRMDDAAIALDLLLTTDDAEAYRLVDQLNRFNYERQEAQRRILEEAMVIASERDLATTRVLVIAAPGWNAGVVGIVAGKLVERFHRPAIVIGIDDAATLGKGSARSIPRFDIFTAIQRCRELLITCGGHELAAGLSLSVDKLEEFDRALNLYAAEVLTDDDLIPRLTHDGVVAPEDLTLALLDEWERLAPHGLGNPEPHFAAHRLTVHEIRRIGRELTHLKMRVGMNPLDTVDCVGWGHGHWSERVGPGDCLEALFAPQINEWNGRRLVQLNIKELRLPSE